MKAAEKVKGKNDKFGPVEVESFITITPSNQKMTVECVAQNLVGQDSSTFPIDQSGKREEFKIQLHDLLF